MAVSILNRKRDLTYLVYFSIHLCIMFRESPSIDVEPLFAFRPILSPDPPPLSGRPRDPLSSAVYPGALGNTSQIPGGGVSGCIFRGGRGGRCPILQVFHVDGGGCARACGFVELGGVGERYVVLAVLRFWLVCVACASVLLCCWGWEWL